MRERSFLGRFMTANLKGEIFDGKIRKAVIINTFSIVGVFSMIYFLIGGIITQKGFYYNLVIIFFLLLTSGTLILFQIKKNTFIASIVIVTLMLLMEVALLAKLGDSTTGIYWFYLYPMLAFFMLERKLGILFSFILLIIAIVIIKGNFNNITHYPEELHERFIFTFIVTSLLAYIFEYIRGLTFNAFVTADKEKSEYLEETLQQKEEIQTQAEILQKTILDLKQMTVAAEETDNSIIITDKNTKIEWINKGFTKMLKYTLEEFQKICPTLIDYSPNSETFKQCIKEKKSQTYQSHFLLKDNSKIWIQSTVTPVLSNKNEVQKLVIVETDITNQKLAEQEIREKNEELQQQRDEILAQKDELEHKNKIISEKNEAISHSISYAQTIQKSILPNLKIFNMRFENFILFKPKDVVSGDFYWMTKADDSFFVATVDCTGHGVPGAFMSILGSRIIDEIVLMENIYSPAEILKKLDEKIIKTLDQKNSFNSDGMDLILCKIIPTNTQKTKITFCGAKRPLIYFDPETKTINTIKGTRKNIGGIKSILNKNKFEDNDIILPKNTILYLASDGFTDQHNDERKRIGSKRLKSLLADIAELNINEQNSILNSFVQNWQQHQNQTDDITVWGIKL